MTRKVVDLATYRRPKPAPLPPRNNALCFTKIGLGGVAFAICPGPVIRRVQSNFKEMP